MSGRTSVNQKCTSTGTNQSDLATLANYDIKINKPNNQSKQKAKQVGDQFRNKKRIAIKRALEIKTEV